MFRKTFAALAMAVMASCHPVYANAVGSEITQANCVSAKVLARQMVIDFQNGATQFDVMRDLNNRPMRDFGPNGENVKLYLQINVNALHRNVAKAFRPNQILSAVERDCSKMIGETL